MQPGEDPMPESEEEQSTGENADSRRSVWEPPKLETLELSSTASGNFPFPIEQFIQNPFTS